jgi:hypothetical protein
MIEIQTLNKCLVMNLVGGKSIIVETMNGRNIRFNYAETFIIPAAAERIKVINDSSSEAILVTAFMK